MYLLFKKKNKIQLCKGNKSREGRESHPSFTQPQKTTFYRWKFKKKNKTKTKKLSILCNHLAFYRTANFPYIAKWENLLLFLHFNGHIIQLCHDLCDYPSTIWTLRSFPFLSLLKRLRCFPYGCFIVWPSSIPFGGSFPKSGIAESKGRGFW